MNLTPTEDEIEVSLFGPGYGEGILVHLGNNEWIVVDSCINPNTGKPASLEYLDNIQVEPDSIKLIIATHWHDDHIRGLFEIVQICQNSVFVFSDAFTKEEFINLLSLYTKSTMIKSSSGLKEFSQIMNHLKTLRKPPKFAIADRVIFNTRQNSDNYCQITALLPSDEAILRSKLQIARLLPKSNEIKRLPSVKHNYSSIVLWISINNKNILLGSDMEIHKNERIGWLSILNSDTRPEGKAIVFKIPHHGSGSAYSPIIWNEMVIPSSYALFTPFKKGNIKLPRKSDIKRICNRTDKCYITADIEDRKPKDRSKISRIMTQTLKNRKLTYSSFGHIRLRTELNIEDNIWDVQLFWRC